MMARIVTLATAPAILVLMFATKAGSHDPVASASWNRDVEPIVRARCFACHRPDGPAHPTLASAEDFRTHRAAVKDAVITRRMPPWSAVRGFGAFERDPSLSPLQISLIASWIEAGAPPTVESPGRPVADPSRHGQAIASQLELDGSANRGVELETVRVGCGTRTRVTSTIYALRPDISSATSLEARIDGETPGILGLFKGPTSQRLTYWLRTPLTLKAKDMLTVLGKECTLDVVVGPRS
jgi:hypothetical protein